MQVLSSPFYRPNAIKPLVHAVRDLGQTIKRLRLQREMTQQELADESGLDIRYVGSIERGPRNPTFGALQGIVCVRVWDNVQAFTDLMNRGLDKPAEQKKVTASEDGPVEVIYQYQWKS